MPKSLEEDEINVLNDGGGIDSTDDEEILYHDRGGAEDQLI